MLVQRPFWKQLIENAWQEKSIIWLMGLRRIGKTSLCHSFEGIEYLDCERPRVRQLMADPEGFLESKKGALLALDEIHRLDNPSELLKLAADHYPSIKIIATGSSTLGASAKFKDTLTGRKREIWLTPLLLQEIEDFGNPDIRHRFLFGGLPSFFARKQISEIDFQEWIDAYWAKDIQDLFSVGKRSSFQKFAELLLAHSGGMFEAAKFAIPCEVTRPTIANYLHVLEETFVVHVIRPYSTHRTTEIVMAPKVYGFDTGFICYVKGRKELRAEDMGFMWEHCVLNEIQGHLQTRAINYWRDKQGHEIDFVLNRRSENGLVAIECKFNTVLEDITSTKLAGLGKNFQAFRDLYPNGCNFIVSHNVDTPFMKKHQDLDIWFVNPKDLIKKLQEK
ncbi:ATP-binding protein [Candidatus Dependentiae bacterium]|nr:ATP-binding protein [Candidatus Dependentiae bacterium]MCC7415227.1 ATP-binding protein [Campylobacterota bacterium]